MCRLDETSTTYVGGLVCLLVNVVEHDATAAELIAFMAPPQLSAEPIVPTQEQEGHEVKCVGADVHAVRGSPALRTQQRTLAARVALATTPSPAAKLPCHLGEACTPSDSQCGLAERPEPFVAATPGGTGLASAVFGQEVASQVAAASLSQTPSELRKPSAATPQRVLTAADKRDGSVAAARGSSYKCAYKSLSSEWSQTSLPTWHHQAPKRPAAGGRGERV